MLLSLLRSAKRWEAVAGIVHGRCINGYSKNDLLLGLIYRAKRWSLSVAGLQSIGSSAVESVDLSHIIAQHLQYTSRVPECMAAVNLDDCSAYKPKDNGGAPMRGEDPLLTSVDDDKLL
jgi:Protein of unknown function (DUF726)